MEKYGYVRVSTCEQNEARQLAALESYNIPAGNMFIEKKSGKDFDRPQWQALTARLQAGDLLIVKSIDRLGRNYGEILEQWRYITKERGVDVLVVDMPLLDTRAQKQDLTGIFIADLVLQILSYVAQTERENIRQRQAEGIAAAYARGIRFGRPPITPPEDFPCIVAAWEQKEIPLAEAIRLSGMKEATFYRRLREYRAASEQERQ